jgi:hypothetical protein
MWQVVSGTVSLQVVATGRSLPGRALMAQRIDRLDGFAAHVGRDRMLSPGATALVRYDALMEALKMRAMRTTPGRQHR